MPESTLTLCQRQLYAPVRDLGFGLRTDWKGGGERIGVCGADGHLVRGPN
jgi:hypothetical protein